MSGTRNTLSNIQSAQVFYLPALTYPTLAASASGTNTASIKGVSPGDLLTWNLQAPPAHIFLENAYVSAADTITLSWSTDGAGIATGSVAALMQRSRPENASLGIANLPAYP